MFPRQTKQMDTVFIKGLFQARDARRTTVNKWCRDYTKLAGISPEAGALVAASVAFGCCDRFRSRLTFAYDASAIGIAVAARIGLAGSVAVSSIMPYETARASSAVS
ncbi:hypothetical protein B0G74_0905 [Paraburkholderia sp. BL9I2N2]|jgi:hypothetical protein|nr:hypothetical protein B0G74_0905 [Paraburkholderia sp. BL9I2N2]